MVQLVELPQQDDTVNSAVLVAETGPGVASVVVAAPIPAAADRAGVKPAHSEARRHARLHQDFAEGRSLSFLLYLIAAQPGS